MSGPTGPTGITGPIGLQGFRGWKGVGYGPTGPPHRSSPYVLKIQSPTGSTITLTEASAYTFYNIAVQSTTTIVFPGRTESYPLPEQAGLFWVFRNNTPSTITLNFSNGTVDCMGNTAATTLDILKGNGTTIAYASNTTGYIAF
jgi:hypothetical protein